MTGTGVAGVSGWSFLQVLCFSFYAALVLHQASADLFALWLAAVSCWPGPFKDGVIDVLVMENIFYDRQISRIYDLKGSERSRFNADAAANPQDAGAVHLDDNLRRSNLQVNERPAGMWLGASQCWSACCAAQQSAVDSCGGWDVPSPLYNACQQSVRSSGGFSSCGGWQVSGTKDGCSHTAGPLL